MVELLWDTVDLNKHFALYNFDASLCYLDELFELTNADISGHDVRIDASGERLTWYTTGNDKSQSPKVGYRYHREWQIQMNMQFPQAGAGETNTIRIYFSNSGTANSMIVSLTSHDTDAYDELTVNNGVYGLSAPTQTAGSVDDRFKDATIVTFYIEYQSGNVRVSVSGPNDSDEAISATVNIPVPLLVGGIDYSYIETLLLTDPGDGVLVKNIWLYTTEAPNTSPFIASQTPANSTTTTDRTPQFTFVMDSGTDFWDGWMATDAGDTYDAVGFELQISTDPLFAEQNIVHSVVVTGDEYGAYTPGSDLPIGDLFWRVRVLDRGNPTNNPSPYHTVTSANLWSDWGDTYTLTISLTTPTVTAVDSTGSPVGATVNVAEELKFGLSGQDADAEYFMWQFEDSSANIVTTEWLPSTNFYYSFPYDDAAWLARVRYKDALGNVSAWSSDLSVQALTINPVAVLTVSAKTIPATKDIMFSLVNSYNENTNATVDNFKFTAQKYDSGWTDTVVGDFYSGDFTNDVYSSTSQRLVSFVNAGATAIEFRVKGAVKDDDTNESGYSAWQYFTVVPATKTPTSLDTLFASTKKPSVVTKGQTAGLITKHQVTKDTYTGGMVFATKNVDEEVAVNGLFFDTAGTSGYETIRDYIRAQTYISITVTDELGTDETLTGYIKSFTMKRQGGYEHTREWNMTIVRFSYDDYVSNCVTGQEELLSAGPVSLYLYDFEDIVGDSDAEQLYANDMESLVDFGTGTQLYYWNMEE